MRTTGTWLKGPNHGTDRVPMPSALAFLDPSRASTSNLRGITGQTETRAKQRREPLQLQQSEGTETLAIEDEESKRAARMKGSERYGARVGGYPGRRKETVDENTVEV